VSRSIRFEARTDPTHRDAGLRNYDEEKAASFFRDPWAGYGACRSAPRYRPIRPRRLRTASAISTEGEEEGLTEETEREGAMYNVVSADTSPPWDTDS
jgi:hypothetical protein